MSNKIGDWLVRNAVIIIACFALGTLWLSATLEFPGTRSARLAMVDETRPPRDEWRRTARGWERMSDWSAGNHRRPRASRLHPGLVAAFELLVTLGVLVALPPEPAAGSTKI